jgi:fumarylacetoacetase
LSTDSSQGLGSLLEISRGGKAPITLPTGESRSFLEDGDEVTLTTERMRSEGLAPHLLSRGSAEAAMYWSAAQIVAHHSSNGCNLQPGDLIGTGTLSTDRDDGLGSLLEISRGGKQAVELPGGETRGFLEDGDEITLRAWCEADGAVRIGFGECVGRVVASA